MDSTRTHEQKCVQQAEAKSKQSPTNYATGSSEVVADSAPLPSDSTLGLPGDGTH